MAVSPLGALELPLGDHGPPIKKDPIDMAGNVEVRVSIRFQLSYTLQIPVSRWHGYSDGGSGSRQTTILFYPQLPAPVYDLDHLSGLPGSHNVE